MKVSKKHLIIAMGVFLVGALLCFGGCKKSGTESTAGKAIAAGVEVCTHCGQIKGGDLCCKPGQTKCSGCGLVKSSPGCCKIPKRAETAAICTKCGQIKGTEVCCKPDQPKCSKCGLVKDSPGCCRMPKI